MELLERLWEGTNSVVNGVMTGVGRGLTGVFGTSNARAVKRHSELAAQINSLEPQLMALSDAELREHTAKLKARLAAGETLDEILVDAFAVCREGGRRFLKMRHYDVQLIGGMVLHGGNIAEMVTGEGKTLVATLPAFLNALEGRGVHVVTVNDYLARRDMEWMAPLYMGLGLSVAAIQSGLPTGQRQAAYASDITYATNNELGFDYLRDNMRMAARGDDRFPKDYQQSQGPLHYAIIDEVDNILIDEARTPLIISGPAHQDPGKYQDADRIARQLKIEQDFIVSEKDHTVNLTDEGIRKAEKLAGVESFYTSGNMEWPHLIDNSLKAHHLYKRDVKYVVKEGTVVIVDEFTGRLMEGRQWSDGLHQAVEAKEGVNIKEENQTLATITLQNFFKLYRKLSGMTGTAMTEQTEFYKTYKLDVVAIPTNRDMQRIEQPDIIFVTEKAKYKAIADDIETLIKFDQIELKNGEVVVGTIVKETDSAIELRKRDQTHTESVDCSQVRRLLRSGRPILVGTVSIEKSERLSKLLEHRGIPHQVLNAKQHKREADIVAQAGRMKAVTIATNMAGRGTDIILGGNPENKAWAMLQDKYPTRLEVPKEEWNELVTRIEEEEQMKPEGERIRSLGGLMVIGTERHESRRIDLQLRGRCGRQGDPGESRFYLSLEDDLMRIFAGDWVKGMMNRLGVGEDEAIQSSFVSKRISAAQKKVEERHFDARKSVLEYDEVMDHQRKRVYGYRQQILDGVSTRKLVLEQIHQQINQAVDSYTAPLYGAESFARFASEKLACELDAKEFRGVDVDTAGNYARDLAERGAETQIMDAIDENLPETETQDEWNYEALAKWSNERYKTNYTARALQQIDRGSIDEELVKQAHAYIASIDLSDGAEYLQDDYGTRMLARWLKAKFSIDAQVDSQAEAETIKKNLRQAAEDAYRQREIRYPIEVALNTFATPGPDGQPVQLSAEIAPWLVQRLDDPALETSLFDGSSVNLAPAFESSKRFSQNAEEQLQEGLVRVGKLFADGQEDRPAATAASPEQLDELAAWLQSELNWQEDVAKLSKLNRRELENRIQQAVDDRFFRELRAAERQVLLQILDETWMAHLLAMDHLRSAVTFRGMGQMDPKIEYKREGMRLFETMWSSVGERVTDVIFRMSTSVARTPAPPPPRRTTVEHHDEPPSAASLNDALQQTGTSGAVSPANRNGQPQPEQRAEGEGGEQRLQPIRRNADRVGRNDPCPCGSGKKYKNCCLRMG